MRLHLACVSSGTYGPFATSASRSRLRLPRTTRLALRASLAGSVGMIADEPIYSITSKITTTNQ